MTGTVQLSSAQAFEEFTDSPYFKYRGCAPDTDDPTRAAGDAALPRNAWITEDRDGAEPQREREARQAAAVEVCLNCPVMVLCDAYATSARPDGRLAEPRGIWGGRTESERKKLFGKREKPAVVVKTMARAVPAPVRLVMTAQREAVLRALAGHTQPESVAAAAGVDVRTANWQRRRLVTMLALPQAVSRRGLLAAAVERGLLDASVVVADDGTVPAVPPPAAPSRAAVSSAVVDGADGSSVPPVEAPAVLRGRVRRPGRRRVMVCPGQLSLDDVLAPVVNLHPHNETLETAA